MRAARLRAAGGEEKAAAFAAEEWSESEYRMLMRAGRELIRAGRESEGKKP